MEINKVISSLIAYALKNDFIPREDEVYCTNRLLEIFNLEAYEPTPISDSIDEIMEAALVYAKENKLRDFENQNELDCFDALIMDAILPRPSQVIDKFNSLKSISPKEATDWYYDFSIKSRYIRTDRLAKNIVYSVKGEKNDLDITINLSKPEKDPKEIARLRTIKSSSYPKCLLCKENEGYYGTYSKPGRSNHRIIPIEINNEKFFLQYSPYGYFNEHCIILKSEHSPMTISKDTFKRFVDFLEQFPHYMIGSNADLPIVGGSILSHEHFQGGNYEFPLTKTNSIYKFKIEGFESCDCSILNWPMSVIRIQTKNKNDLVELSNKILTKWRNYTDVEGGIIAYDEDKTPHNTITPISRMRKDKYEIDLVLRNNLTSQEHPDGIFHPHQELHHIKKENIGLIEVMGLAVLPGRLKDELNLCGKYLIDEDKDINPLIEKHMDWLKQLSLKHTFTKENVEDILRQEVGLVFERVLTDCGVYKLNTEGLDAFKKFIKTI
jgi:UDPglucose--hexose-1-phosphate uridylyltransferase